MCGITAALALDGGSISLDKFKFAMKTIESRGKQSVGLVSNTYERKELGNVDNFIKKTLWTDVEEPSVMIGHNRAPSIGTDKTIKSTQPVVVEDIVIGHNGTIDNMEDIADKFKIEYDKIDTDTVILAKILNNIDNIDALNYIDGSATIVWYYNNKPTEIYVFRSNVPSESTRPLYYAEINNVIYFSSEEDSLELIADSNEDSMSIKEVPLDSVYKFDFKGNGDSIFTAKYNDELHYAAYYDWKKKESYSSNTNASVIIKNKDVVELLNVNRIFKQGESIIVRNSKSDITGEIINNYSYKLNQLIYYKGLYFINGIVCDGKYFFDKNNIRKFHLPNMGLNNDDKEYYFSKGILISDKNKAWIFEDGAIPFGTIKFAKSILMYTNQPIPYFNNGILMFLYNDSISEVVSYHPIGVDPRVYEFYYGYYSDMYRFIDEDLHVSDIVTVDDELYTVKEILGGNNIKVTSEKGTELVIKSYNITELVSDSVSKVKTLTTDEVVSVDVLDEDSDDKTDKKPPDADIEVMRNLFSENVSLLEDSIDELNAILHVQGAVELIDILDSNLVSLQKLITQYE